jgi:hypothetical protein
MGLSINNSMLAQYHDSACYLQMESLHNKTLEAHNYLGKIQKQMVETSEGTPGNPAPDTGAAGQTDNSPEIRFTNLANPYSKVPARDLLMPGCSVRQEMNKILSEYMNYVTTLTTDRDSGKFKGLLDPSIYLPGGGSVHNDLTLLSALHSVEILKNNLLAVESCMFSYIAKH